MNSAKCPKFAIATAIIGLGTLLAVNGGRGREL
jgi:hypothetical protein